MASALYNNYKLNMCKIDWTNVAVNVRCMLVDSTYALDIDAHLHKSDIDTLSVEISGTGYTAGGELLTTKVVTIDNVTDSAKFNADDITWTASTLTARGAIVYLDSGNVNTSTLIDYIDFGVDKSSSASDFVIQWNTDGIFKLA